MTLDELTNVIEARPTPTPQQWDAARRYVTTHAPDLIAVIFGQDGDES